jgi:hypothetical protein
MNAQTADINIVGNKADVDEVIRCEQLTKRYQKRQYPGRGSA